eukprot:TRINITY_DN740_c0_g1_i4.p1 TRINITY_DN740_c0_g1~~TRINITY_DN740_c0_g1_i4.p1  ORF type:complete len:192 (-),score=9.35 TRINITY_DN740_c0_g1_i4:104-679(-)
MCIRDRYQRRVHGNLIGHLIYFHIQILQKMPPKVNPAELKIIQVKVFGGEAGPASTLAPKLGPLGLNAKKIGEDIIKIGGQMKGIRQMIQLKVQNRQAEISVLPTASTLLIQQLGEPPRDRKKSEKCKTQWKSNFRSSKKSSQINGTQKFIQNFRRDCQMHVRNLLIYWMHCRQLARQSSYQQDQQWRVSC